MSNIVSLANYVRAVFPFDIFNDCFGGKIRLTDVDGEVERNGRFLRLEIKSPGKDIPIGQQILFRQLIDTGIYDIFVLWGNSGTQVKEITLDGVSVLVIKPGNPSITNLRWYRHDGKIHNQECDLDQAHNLIERWYSWADCQPRNK